MTDKELRRLSRLELLEMLVEQSKRADALEEELKECKKQLEDKTIALQEAGNIAQAALALNGVFEACQAAADQYLENVKAMVKVSDDPVVPEEEEKKEEEQEDGVLE